MVQLEMQTLTGVDPDTGENVYETIDLNFDGSIQREEWVQHINTLAIEQGRERAIALLAKLEEVRRRGRHQRGDDVL